MIFDEVDGNLLGDNGDFLIITDLVFDVPAEWNDRASLVQSIRGKWRCFIYYEIKSLG